MCSSTCCPWERSRVTIAEQHGQLEIPSSSTCWWVLQTKHAQPNLSHSESLLRLTCYWHWLTWHLAIWVFLTWHNLWDTFEVRYFWGEISFDLKRCLQLMQLGQNFGINRRWYHWEGWIHNLNDMNECSCIIYVLQLWFWSGSSFDVAGHRPSIWYEMVMISSLSMLSGMKGARSPSIFMLFISPMHIQKHFSE